VVEGAGEVEQSGVEPPQQRQALLRGQHRRHAGLPPGRRQQAHRPPHPLPQPAAGAPPAGRALPSPPPLSVVLVRLQLVLQAHQEFVQEVGYEGVAEDQGGAPGPRGDLPLSGIQLDDIDVLLTQGLVAWMIIGGDIKGTLLYHQV